MSRVAFLLDEHVPAYIADAVVAAEPLVSIATVGVHPWAPPKQTPDPDLLLFAEAEGLTIVTFDKETMPLHAANHVAAGRHTWGVFVYPRGKDMSAGQIADELVFIWSLSEPSEWVDRVVFLPL